MKRLCVPALALATALPGLAWAQAAVGGTASASATISVKVSDEEALSDDILAVIDLPIVAAEAREAGIAEDELDAALEVTKDAGLSAGDAAEVVAEEVETTKKRGAAQKGFGQWVRMQVVTGLRGKKLAAKIRDRKAELKELTPEQASELKGKIDGVREKNRAFRDRAEERRKELLDKGKKRVLVAKERHEQREARLGELAAKVGEQSEALKKRLEVLEGKLATATDDEKAAMEAEKARLEKAVGATDKAAERVEKREDRVEKREAKLDKLEAKIEAREEKREAKIEAREEKREARSEAKAAKDKGPQ